MVTTAKQTGKPQTNQALGAVRDWVTTADVRVTELLDTTVGVDVRMEITVGTVVCVG